MTNETLRKNHFERLKNYRQSVEYAEYAKENGAEVPRGDLHSLLGDKWEIDADIYREFLEMLPPLGWRSGSFYMSEFTFDDITAKFSKEGDKYFCEFARYPKKDRTTPIHTPWGFAQSVCEVAPGISRYDTASHGGYYLTPERVAEMPKPLREFKPWAGANWFEEDCDWSVVALAFPQYFPDDAIPQALATLRHYRPEIYEQIAGKDRWAIHYASRELARELGDPQLGVVHATSKEEAEDMAWQDGEIVGKAMPAASLWAVKIKKSGPEQTR